jgi:hypothetical protein
MTEGEMKKVSAWIPQETLTKLEEKGYHNRAEAIRLGLERLLMESNGEPIKESIWKPVESTENTLESIQKPMESIIEGIRNPMESNGIQYEIMKSKNEDLEKRHEIERTYLKKEIERLAVALQESPDPVELVEVRAHFEGLQKLLEEKTKTIDILNREVEGLQKEVERLDMFAHYFKSVEVKQIEAPVAEKVKPWWKFW